jgi:hypothetical protein
MRFKFYNKLLFRRLNKKKSQPKRKKLRLRLQKRR